MVDRLITVIEGLCTSGKRTGLAFGFLDPFDDRSVDVMVHAYWLGPCMKKVMKDQMKRMITTRLLSRGVAVLQVFGLRC